MKRLFACDLDGTLFNCLHTTDPFILHAIQNVLKSGNYFTIATGRNMHKAQIHKYFHDLPVFCVCMNGARIITDQDEVIYEKWLDSKWIAELIDQFPDIPFEFNSRNHTYVRFSKEEYKKYAYKPKWYIRLLRSILKADTTQDYIFNATKEEILKEDIFKINFALSNSAKKARLDAYLQKRKNEIINAPFVGTGFYELTDSSVNKGTALKKLADFLQLDYDFVNVYGDGMNDIAMLEMFEHSYVPDNGCAKAKEIGKYHLGKNMYYSVPRHMLKSIQSKERQ